MNLLEISNITISYTQKIAVENISFNIQNNDYLSIIGHNGSGKSSLIKAIVGIVPFCKGTIKFNINKNNISYLSQTNKIPFDFPATVYEIVLTGTQKNNKYFHFYTKNDKEAAYKSLEKLNVYNLKNKKIGEISGGQLQRVLLARSLAKNPKLLILDEPCSGLDEKTTNSFYSLLKNLNEKDNVTILMVSHDIDNVLKYSKHILLMNKNLKFFGNKNEWKAYRERTGIN